MLLQIAPWSWRNVADSDMVWIRLLCLVFVCVFERVGVCAHGRRHRASPETKGSGNVSNTSCGFPLSPTFPFPFVAASLTTHFPCHRSLNETQTQTAPLVLHVSSPEPIGRCWKRIYCELKAGNTLFVLSPDRKSSFKSPPTIMSLTLADQPPYPG